MKYLCPVCGYAMDDPPRDYNICPSCGTEFGYHDSDRTYEELRWTWLNSGARWWSPVDTLPPGWNPYIQLFKAGLAVKPTNFIFEKARKKRREVASFLFTIRRAEMK